MSSKQTLLSLIRFAVHLPAMPGGMKANLHRSTSPAMHRRVVALAEQGKTAQQILDTLKAIEAPPPPPPRRRVAH